MDLVRIEKSQGGREVVNARHLHEVLHVLTPFSKWINRMFEYGFIENTDYAIVKKVQPENQQFANPNPAIDYVLTIDCSKHIAMMQRNAVGMRVRQYFIDYEKRNMLVVTPRTRIELAKAELLLLEELETKDRILLEQAPKVEFFDHVTQSTSEVSIGEASKILNVGIGPYQLFEKLRSLSVLNGDNIPYQEYINRGWFRVVENKYRKRDGTHGISLKTVVYQKGLEGIMRLVKKI